MYVVMYEIVMHLQDAYQIIFFERKRDQHALHCYTSIFVFIGLWYALLCSFYQIMKYKILNDLFKFFYFAVYIQ